MVRVSTFLVAPMMVGFAICADSVVPILLGSQWLDIIPYVRIFSLMFAFFPITSIMFQSLLAHGRSDLALRLEVVKNILGFMVLYVALTRTPLFLAVMVAIVYAPIGLSLNYLPNIKLSGYSMKMLISDVCSSILISVVMGAAVVSLSFFMKTGWFLLLSQIIIGGGVYLTIAYVFKVQAFQTVHTTISNLLSAYFKKS